MKPTLHMLSGGSAPLDTKHGQYVDFNPIQSNPIQPCSPNSQYTTFFHHPSPTLPSPSTSTLHFPSHSIITKLTPSLPPTRFLGPWGNIGSQPQKGITSYAISANRQRPLAGTAHAAVFNSWRRFRAQVLYVVPPLLLFYGAMNWANEK